MTRIARSVTGFRASPDAVEGEAIIIASPVEEGALNKRRFAWAVNPTDAVVQSRVSQNPILQRTGQFIGENPVRWCVGGRENSCLRHLCC